MAVLEIRELCKHYGEIHAVDGISFAVEAGEIFGLLGPNGAGKSTTINVIAGLVRPDAGEVTVAGTPLSTAAAYKRKLGYVPQEISLAEKLTGRENLRLIGRLYDLGGGDLKRRVEETLHLVGLADRANEYVSAFSGGMKRRLNIAGALLHEPDLLLLDEPTAGVDPQARAYIFDIVERLAAAGRAVLYTTHYMEEAQRLCRRTAIIDHGRILAAGALAELIQGVKARRELVVHATNLTTEKMQRLSEQLGGAAWTMQQEIANLSLVGPEVSLLQAVRAADEAGIALTSIAIEEPNLETVFLELTGRALRE